MLRVRNTASDDTLSEYEVLLACVLITTKTRKINGLWSGGRGRGKLTLGVFARSCKLQRGVFSTLPGRRSDTRPPSIDRCARLLSALQLAVDPTDGTLRLVIADRTPYATRELSLHSCRSGVRTPIVSLGTSQCDALRPVIHHTLRYQSMPFLPQCAPLWTSIAPSPQRFPQATSLRHAWPSLWHDPPPLAVYHLRVPVASLAAIPLWSAR